MASRRATFMEKQLEVENKDKELVTQSRPDVRIVDPSRRARKDSDDREQGLRYHVSNPSI